MADKTNNDPKSQANSQQYDQQAYDQQAYNQYYYQQGYNQQQRPQQQSADFDGSQFGKASSNGYDVAGNEPVDMNGWQIMGQTALGLVIGLVIAFLLFVILTIVGTMFTDAMQADSAFGGVNPIIPMIMMLIAFISTLIGTLMTAGLYSMLYSKFYYDSGKMLKLVSLSNVFIFLALAPVYLVFMREIDTLFFVLAFHVFFSIFISYCQMSFATNPNYSGSYLVGNMAGFVGCVLIYALADKYTGTVALNQKLYVLMLVPSIVSFSLIPLVSGIWNLIYYKFYEMGNNFFYIPSISDVLAEQNEVQDEASVEDDVNVNF